MDNEDQSNDSESGEVAEESDSSEDEVHYLAFFFYHVGKIIFSLAAHSLNHCYFIRWYLEIQSEMFP